MKYTNTLAISFVTIATMMLIIGGSIMQNHGVFALRYEKNKSDNNNWSLQQTHSNGIGVGLISGAGPYYDSRSTQANDDGGGSTLIKANDRTLVEDAGGIEGSGPNNQQTQQGDHNFNNQQYYSTFICLICK